MAHNRSTGAAFSWSEFASEGDPEPITASSSPNASPNPIPPRLSRKTRTLRDADDEFGGLSAFPSEAVDEAPVQCQADPDVVQPTIAASEHVSTHSPVSRWARAVAAAFVFGAVSTLAMMAILDSRATSPSVVTGIDALAVSDGIPVTALADFDGVEMRPPVPVARPKRVAPAPQRVVAPQPDELALDVRPDEIVTAYSESAARTTVPAADVHSTASDEQGVRQKLRSYESYQGAGFRACSVVVSGEQATAECRGTLTATPGPDSASATSEHQWTFKMRRDGGTWKIDEVSRSLPMDAPR